MALRLRAAALIGLALIAVTIAVIQGGLSAALMIALAVAAVGAGALILLVAIVGGFLALSAGFDAARAAPRRAMTALHRRGR